MAEKKSVGHAYNVDFLNVVFAASSLFLFLSVIWMVWDDFDRDWKNTQRQFAQLEYAGHAGQPRSRPAARSTRASSRSSTAAGGGRARRTSPPISRRSTISRRKLKDADNALFRATHRLPDDEGDLRSGSLRLRGDAGQRPVERREEGDDRRRTRRKQLHELDLAREKAEADKADVQKQLGQYTGEVVDRAEVDRRDQRRAEPPAQAPRRDRAEHGEGLLPQRAAARLHGADAQDPADHPAQRRGRRELHPRRRRWIAARPAIWRSTRRATRSIRSRSRRIPNLATYLGGSSPHPIDKIGLHRLPRRHGAVGELPRRGAHAARTRSRRKSGRRSTGWEQPHLWDYPMLPVEHDRGVVRQVPQAAGLHSEGRQAEHRLRDVRARRLLRVPQDQGLRERARSPGRS